MKEMLKTILFKAMYKVGLSKEVSNYLFKKTHGTNINWGNPVLLDEKLMVLKHGEYWNNSLVTQCADKLGVRSYVKQCGCEKILTELCGGGIITLPTI